MVKIKTYYIPDDKEESIRKFEELAWKERTSASKLIISVMEEYVEHHSDGNPVFTLDQFTEEGNNMKAVPAVFRNRDDWQEYIENMPEKEAQKLLWQIQTIGSLAEKKVNHGTTHVRYS